MYVREGSTSVARFLYYSKSYGNRRFAAYVKRTSIYPCVACSRRAKEYLPNAALGVFFFVSLFSIVFTSVFVSKEYFCRHRVVVALLVDGRSHVERSHMQANLKPTRPRCRPERNSDGCAFAANTFPDTSIRSLFAMRTNNSSQYPNNLETT